jgi:hypothetical protein
MDITVGGQHGSGTRHPTSALASLQIVGRILNWLTGPFRLTTAEQEKDAGIYLGDQR